MRRQPRLTFGFLLATLALGDPALGQDLKAVGLKEEVKAEEKLETGWHKKLIFGGSLSFGTSDQVVGQPNGQTNTFGLNVEGELKHKTERAEWRNSLKIGESATRTPAIPRYVKVNDELNFETLYLYTLESVPWFGPYVKVSAAAPVFRGEDVRAEDKTYAITDRSGGVSNITTKTLRLTDGFKPLQTKESVGGFAKLLTREALKIEARVGLGALQVNADGQLAIKDDASTATIEVRELESYDQVGVEVGFSVKGSFDAKTSYSLDGEALSPVAVNPKPRDNRSNFDLTNWELKARLTSKLYDWLSLDYTARLVNQPQLVDELQTQTLFLLNVTYQLL